ncbi:MAG: peptide deformylase [Bdellovibrionales bacterium]
MSRLKILTYPDPRLKEVSQPVTVFDAKLKQLAEDMLEAMYDAKGIGLAAPQVGELKRFLVIDTRPRDEEGRRYEYDEMTEMEKKVPQPLRLVNPRIVGGEGKQTFDEGCLSIPGFYETVERFNVVEVEAEDLNGKTFRFKTDGLLAVCVQHEMDHLEGKLFIDRISFVKSNRIKSSIKKNGYLKKDSETAGGSSKKSEKVEV